MTNHVQSLIRPWSNAAFCGTPSGFILFAQTCKSYMISIECQSLFSEKNKKKYQFFVCLICPEMVKVTHPFTALFITVAGLSGAVGCASYWRPGGRGVDPRRGRQHSFVEIDREIFSTVILSLPLIQEGQLSVSKERMCTILVNRLGLSLPSKHVNMTPVGWLGRKTSTQTNITAVCNQNEIVRFTLNTCTDRP